MEAKDLSEMKELVKKLNDYAYHYYVLGKPIVADYDYDVLYDKLLALEKETGVVLDDSPSKRVGGEVLSGFKKVEHEKRLYSLNKCNDIGGLEKFIEDVKKIKRDAKFTVEYKFDGLRIIAKYEDGKLIQASTRGNGFVGEDVTEQVKTIKSVPLVIDYKGKLTVAGEGIMTLENLAKYNAKATEKLKNTRNAVAGAIRNLDPRVTAERNLDVVFYDIVSIENPNIKTQVDVQNFLKENKFLTGKLFEICLGVSEIMKIADKVDKVKTTLNIQIDGLVIKLNDLKTRERLGYTAKFPKWAIAYKFAPVELTTKLLKVEWNVGRTGKVTPIAVIEPVFLAGATVSRATLNNYDDILRKGVKIGSLVFIRRSNEVIPEILGLAQEGENSKDIEMPKYCPSCGSSLIKIGPNLFCQNENCREKVIAKISYFASRDCMNIEGLSDKLVALLYDKCNVRTFSDLYTLRRENLEHLAGFKDKKIGNILSSIEKSKTCKLNSFIDAISIEGVGEKTAKDLVKKFASLDNLKKATMPELLSIRDIGNVIAESIIRFFASPKNLDEIGRLISCGVKILSPTVKSNAGGFFDGKKVVLTGTLKNYARSKATEIIESMGGEVSSSVSKNTNYVLVGSEPGSKFNKAKALGIPLLYEEDFERIIKAN